MEHQPRASKTPPRPQASAQAPAVDWSPRKLVRRENERRGRQNKSARSKKLSDLVLEGTWLSTANMFRLPNNTRSNVMWQCRCFTTYVENDNLCWINANSPQRYKNNDKIDDEDGHYIVQEGSSIGNRYNLVNLLGQGTFGKVVRARDSKNREFAVKIIRAVPKVCPKVMTLPSHLSNHHISTATLHVSSFVCSRHYDKPTARIATDASN
jgi:hypothetical protein